MAKSKIKRGVGRPPKAKVYTYTTTSLIKDKRGREYTRTYTHKTTDRVKFLEALKTQKKEPVKSTQTGKYRFGKINYRTEESYRRAVSRAQTKAYADLSRSKIKNDWSESDQSKLKDLIKTYNESLKGVKQSLDPKASDYLQKLKKFNELPRVNNLLAYSGDKSFEHVQEIFTKNLRVVKGTNNLYEKTIAGLNEPENPYCNDKRTDILFDFNIKYNKLSKEDLIKISKLAAALYDQPVRTSEEATEDLCNQMIDILNKY